LDRSKVSRQFAKHEKRGREKNRPEVTSRPGDGSPLQNYLHLGRDFKKKISQRKKPRKGGDARKGIEPDRDGV